jgi:two-component system chemotaxis response regulator CheY
VVSSPPKSVLVVDDNEFIRHFVCQLFTGEADFVVCGEAANGSEAIEKAQELQPGLIVMDLSMPVMNGIDAARRLKRLMPSVPIVMFSDYAHTFAEQEARSVGIAACLSKSGPASVLIGTARSLLTRVAA